MSARRNILDEILETKRKEVAALKERHSLDDLKKMAADAPRPRNFFSAVTKKPAGKLVNLIAEVKKASPSAGIICEDFDPPAIARAYEQAGADDVLITNGAIGANFLVEYTLVEPGDRVVCVQPTYQQVYSVPASFGADVRLLRLRPRSRKGECRKPFRDNSWESSRVHSAGGP